MLGIPRTLLLAVRYSYFPEFTFIITVSKWLHPWKVSNELLCRWSSTERILTVHKTRGNRTRSKEPLHNRCLSIIAWREERNLNGIRLRHAPSLRDSPRFEGPRIDSSPVAHFPGKLSFAPEICPLSPPSLSFCSFPPCSPAFCLCLWSRSTALRITTRRYFVRRNEDAVSKNSAARMNSPFSCAIKSG